MLKYTKMGASRLDMNDNEVVAIKGNERYHLRLITKELSDIGNTYKKTTTDIQSTFNDINRSRTAMINQYEEELVKRTEEKTDLELEIFKLKKELQRKQDIIAKQELEIRKYIRQRSVLQMNALDEKDEQIVKLKRNIKLLEEELEGLKKENANKVHEIIAKKDAGTSTDFVPIPVTNYSTSIRVDIKPRFFTNTISIKMEPVVPSERVVYVMGLGRHTTTKEIILNDFMLDHTWLRTSMC